MNQKIKVVYYTTPFFWDMDLSFMRSMKEKVDLYVILEVAPFSKQATALNLECQVDHNGVVCAKDYPGMEGFAKYLELDRIFVANMRKNSIFTLSYLACVNEVRKLIREIDPDIIHVNNFPNGILGLLPFLNRIHFVTMHDPVPHIGDTSIQSRLWKHLFFQKFKNVLLFNKEQTETFLSRFSRYNLKVFHSKLGPYECLEDQQSIQSRPLYPFILFAGRITRYKGIDVLLETFSRLSERFPELHLIVAGKGEYWFDISSYINHPRIHVRNEFISKEELAILLRDAQCVVCPYIEATQSGVIMSSFAFCTPVIATNVGGLPEMVENGKTGYIVEANDVRKLENALSEYLSDPSKRQQLSSAIRSKHHGTGSHSWNAITDEVLGAYYSIYPQESAT